MQPSGVGRALWIVLVAIGLGLTGLGLWLLPRAWQAGAPALAVGLLSCAAGLGLRRGRRWGAALLGLLGLAGSANTIAGGLLGLAQQFSAAGVLQTLLGLAAAAFFARLAIQLWRSSRKGW